MGLPSPGNTSSVRLPWLAALFLVSFAIRIGTVAAFTGLGSPPSSGGDEAEYDSCAWNLVQGNGYRGYSPDVVDSDGRPVEHPTAYRPPTSVLYFAAIYAPFGHSYLAAQVVNSLVATATVLLVFAITRRTFGTGAAWLAAIVYACYPIALYYNLSLHSESLGAFLVCLFVWLCLGIREPGGTWWAIAAGLGLGALLLCKPGYVFLIPLLPFWALAVCRGDRRLWLRAAIIPVAAGFVILPWAVRNSIELGKFIPFGTGGGSLLLQANNRILVADARYHGYAVWETSLQEYAPAIREPNDEFERDAVAKKFAIEWLKDNPDKWFYLARGKFWRLWAPWFYGTTNRQVALAACLYYGIILTGFLLACIPVTRRLIRDRDPALIMQALIVATTAIALVFHGQHRYRFPIDSLLMVMAAGGAAMLADRWRRKADAGGGWHLSRMSAVVAVLGVAGTMLFAAACVFDERHIDEYRHAVARQRLEAMAAAIKAYQHDHGKPPGSLEELVPSYLPTVEALHCPTHSLEYGEYLLLESRDATAAAAVVSYRLRPAAPGRPAAIVQSKGIPLIETYPLRDRLQ